MIDIAKLKNCQGHCCKKFTLSVNDVTLEAYKDFPGITGKDSYFAFLNMPLLNEIHFDTETRTKIVYMRKCNKQDQNTNLCTCYEDRPNFCQKYPFNSLPYQDKTNFLEDRYYICEYSRNEGIGHFVLIDTVEKKCYEDVDNIYKKQFEDFIERAGKVIVYEEGKIEKYKGIWQ